ncbi:MAG TPA: iron ABC transporter permease [Deltaproteobacteria bacterium]|nr:iron ABC transporter permease [Deltaproteobacteria bacterium]
MERSVVTLSRVIKISLILLAVFSVIAVISLLVGPARISFFQGLKGLLFGWQDGSTVLTPTEKTIIFSIRLPRVLFAGLVGASLSAAGVIFQALLRNPLADPYILGISGGSAVGAIIGIIIGIGAVPFAIPGLAFCGAASTVTLVFFIGRSNRELHSTTLLLAGVIVNAFFSAVIMFLLSISTNTELHSITFWLMGDLALSNWFKILFVTLMSFMGFSVIYSYARSLNLIVTGEETALQLGINVERTKIVLFMAGSLLTAVAVSFSGIIGFVGLIIPHMMRILFGSDHRLLLPASFLFGASFLVVADTIARTIIPHTELPVGVITAICGAPYFVYLLRRRSI